VELLNSEKDNNKTFSLLRINEGVNLFIEDASVVHPVVKSQDFKWESEFELESNRYSIKFNLPSEAQTETDEALLYT